MTAGRALRAAVLAAAVLAPAVPGRAGETDLFTIARLQYDGGGDWYSDPSSLPNLLAFLGGTRGCPRPRPRPASSSWTATSSRIPVST